MANISETASRSLARWGISAVLVTGATLVLLAQTQEPPTFRSAIEAVQIDVYVTDADGNPVSGLTIDDFELFESGKPQPITTFEAVDIPIERAETVERTLAEPDVLTNETPLGRVYLFALDEIRIGGNILRTRRFVRQFIENHFGPNDIGAIALIGRGLATDGQDFTNNRRLLLNAADKFSGGFGEPLDQRSIASDCARDGWLPTGAHDGRSRADFGLTTTDATPRLPTGGAASGLSQQMASLRSLTEMMARIPGRHKAMLLFTECLDIDMLDLVDYQGGVLTVRGDDAHAVMASATRSNLTIYPIDPSGLSSTPVPAETIGAFRSLGEATGGFALINSNSFTQAFERIVRDNSTYYMLGFNSGYEKDDGRYVRVEVRVKRPGLTVRTRAGYTAPTRIMREEQERIRARTASSAVSTALASPLATRGVPMRVFAVPFKGRGRNAAVAIAVELDAASLDLQERNGVLSGRANVRYLATDAKRKVYPEVSHTASVEVKRDVPGPVPVDRIRVRIVSQLELPAGRYQLRVAAGSSLVAGNVIYDLEVPDFGNGPLAISGLMLVAQSEPLVLTLNSSSQGSTQAVKCFSDSCRAPSSTSTTDFSLTPSVTQPLLRDGTPGAPTTRREFTAGETIVLVAEVYDNTVRPSQGTPFVISFTADLLGTDGKAFPVAAEQQPARPMREGATGHAFRVPISIPAVPSGSYTLRVQARSNADNERIVSREIPIRVK